MRKYIISILVCLLSGLLGSLGGGAIVHEVVKEQTIVQEVTYNYPPNDLFDLAVEKCKEDVKENDWMWVEKETKIIQVTFDESMHNVIVYVAQKGILDNDEEEKISVTKYFKYSYSSVILDQEIIDKLKGSD